MKAAADDRTSNRGGKERSVLAVGVVAAGDHAARGDVRVYFDRPEAPFDDFDAVILPYGYCIDAEEAERQRRKAELARLLAKGGLVCWLLGSIVHQRRYARQPFAEWVKVDAALQAFEYPELEYLRNHGGFVPSDRVPGMVAMPVSRRREFDQWAKSRSSATHRLEVVHPDKYARATVLCTDRGGYAVGAAFPVDAGHVVALPYMVADYDEQHHVKAMTELAAALIEYRDSITAAPPAWLSEVFFGDEGQIRGELQKLAEETARLESQLEPFQREKEILYLRDTLLEASVVAALERRGLRIERGEVDERVEDFLLLNAEGEKSAICEVKSGDRNVRPAHVTQLSHHRAQRELDHDFPGLLVANTFCKAATAGEKDQRVPPNVVKQALHDHVLVTRTLDLLRLFDLVEREEFAKDGLLGLLTEKPGWLHVKETGEYEVVTK